MHHIYNDDPKPMKYETLSIEKLNEALTNITKDFEPIEYVMTAYCKTYGLMQFTTSNWPDLCKDKECSMCSSFRELITKEDQ